MGTFVEERQRPVIGAQLHTLGILRSRLGRKFKEFRTIIEGRQIQQINRTSKVGAVRVRLERTQERQWDLEVEVQ